MDNELLRGQLEALHLEIIGLPRADKPLQDERDAFAAYLTQLINQRDLTKEHLVLKDRIKDAVDSLESDYPKVTSLINGVTEMLNSIGI